MKELQLTVDFAKVRAGAVSSKPVDIARLVSEFPGVEILAGDPAISVHIRLPEHDEKRLRAAVEKVCVVESYVDLDLYSSTHG